jgi:hypothetical protein
VDGKRPDGLTLMLWQGGKALVWDVRVANTQTESYVDTAARAAGGAAESAASRKCAKYANLSSGYSFLPIAVETLGPINISATDCLSELGHRISMISGDERETTFLFQRIYVAIQRFNAVLIHEIFVNLCDELDL